ncbi:hypothetical protein [Parvularcula sp. LCG005]|uniref:hypothetical protein n=1 Tax=Parvularcula sp. LCG005 TaxID=3078805 RepID=UPI002943098F|nr:hypothetical protein [Parvularcula sp. LCG005]WOI54190.1 hypothetical protein RUI03_04130 [Parvularcula sp. LCG005]
MGQRDDAIGEAISSINDDRAVMMVLALMRDRPFRRTVLSLVGLSPQIHEMIQQISDAPVRPRGHNDNDTRSEPG